MEKIKTILLIGAYERDNLGDLLFLKIFKKILKNYNIISGSIIGNDLTKFNGDKIISAFNIPKNIKINAIIHCGGEILTCSTESALNMDIKEGKMYKNAFPNHQIGYIFDNNTLNRSEKTKIGYFSVGGSNSLLYKNKRVSIKELKNKLTNAQSIYVREKYTQKNLTKYLNIKSKITPDLISLIPLSHKFEINNAKKNKYYQKIKKIKKFFVFQASDKYLTVKRLKNISKELAIICNKYKLSLVIQPMGLANYHDSISKLTILLNEVKKNTKQKCILQKDKNVWIKVAVISDSTCNIGTSLHLQILSTAFGIPCISLINKKVNLYSEAWKNIQPYNIKVNEISKKFTLINEQNKQNIKKYSIQAIEKTKKSLDSFLKELNLSPNYNFNYLEKIHEDIYFTTLNSELKSLRIELSNQYIRYSKIQSKYNQIVSSKFFKLWPIYCKLKSVFKINE